eukprot:m.206859 g.206859  ORF g.206859 m.206859 type:complete len:84 (+) comp32972_c3_seq1:4154-4405(+)
MAGQFFRLTQDQDSTVLACILSSKGPILQFLVSLQEGQDRRGLKKPSSCCPDHEVQKLRQETASQIGPSLAGSSLLNKSPLLQ